MSIKPFVASGLLLAGVALAACNPMTDTTVEETPVMIEEDSTTIPEEPILEEPMMLEETTMEEDTTIEDETTTTEDDSTMMEYDAQ